MNSAWNPFNFAQSLMESTDPNAIRLSEKYPPVHLWNPPFCGDIPMRIARDGTWYYQNSPITRHRMVQLFSRILRHEKDGCYYLVTPVEKVRIQVEDAPFVATQVTQQGEGKAQQLIFTTQVGDHIIADQQHPIHVEQKNNQPAPYLLVRDKLTALIHRNVYYQLVEWAVPSPFNDLLLGIWSDGKFFQLGSIS